MSVVLKRIPGVRSVTVSLERGEAEIVFEPHNRASVAEVQRAIRSGGYEPKAATLRVAGTLRERDGVPTLEVDETGAVYVLSGAQLPALDRGSAGTPVTVLGQLRPPDEDGRSPVLEVQRLESFGAALSSQP